MPPIIFILTAAISLLLPVTATAQTGPRNVPVDCRQGKNPERCLATQKAQQTCQGKIAGERQACLRALLPPNCNKARDPQRCRALLKVRENCRGKVDKDYRNCQRQYLEKPKKAKPSSQRR